MRLRKFVVSLLIVISAVFFLRTSLAEEVASSSKERVRSEAGECIYVGVKACAFCHVRLDDSVRTWAITKHANAVAALRTPAAKQYSANPDEDPKCLKCHITGMVPGSVKAEGASHVAVGEEFYGVQCEVCHGPGNLYKNEMARALPKSRELNMQECTRRGLLIPTEETCRRCHNAECPVFTGFDFEKAVKLIKHGEAEKKCEYIGQEKCTFCHVKADESATTWVIMKHINSFSVLQTKLAEMFSKDPTHDEKCLECHSTGLNAPGGYSVEDPGNERLKGVQCEMCHGWGYSYVKSMAKAKILNKHGVMDDCVRDGLIMPDEKVCIRCHNERCPVFTGFDFEASIDQIKHGMIFRKY